MGRTSQAQAYPLRRAKMCIRDSISYTPTAVLYDEQPITFRDSWNQRFRWAKGFYQVFGKYGARLAKGIVTNPKGSRFACYDMLMTIAPGMLLTIVSVLFNAIIIVLAATGAMSTGVMIASSVSSIFFCLFNYLMFMFMFGVLTTFVEWDSIRSTTRKKVRYMFTFPLFLSLIHILHAGADAHAFERAFAPEALADGREHGHVAVGPQDAGKSFVGQAEVLDVVVLGHGVSLVMVWRLFCFQRTTRAICPPQAPAALHKDHG